MKTVKVTANPKTGLIFTKSENLDKNGKVHGFIRVESQEVNLDFANNGPKTRSCLINMTEEAYQKQAHLLTNGKEIPGSIIRQDSLTPWYAGQEPLKTKEGKTITSNGTPIYRQERFTSKVDAQDVKLESYDRVEVSSQVIAD